MITITFNPTTEAQARLFVDLMVQYLTIADTAEPAETKEVAPPAPKPRKAKPEPVAEVTDAKPTIVDVRAVLGPLSQAGKAGEVKALLAEFGVTKLTEVAEGMYAELLAKAKEL